MTMNGHNRAHIRSVQTKRFYRHLDRMVSNGYPPKYGLVCVHWPHWSDPRDTITATIIIRTADDCRVSLEIDLGSQVSNPRIRRIIRRIRSVYGIELTY